MPKLSDLAKKAAPGIARAVPSRFSRAAGIYLDVVQGKGSGTGWDMAGETAADATVLRGIARPMILDGGANYGQWARSINAVLSNPNATFFLFEPQQACQEALRRIGLPNSTVIRAALGDQPGEAVLSGESPGYGAASIYDRRDTYFGDMSAHKERVAMVTIDDTIRDHSIDRVDLLKLDVEGAELAALRGAKASMSDGVIQAVAFASTLGHSSGTSGICSRRLGSGSQECYPAAGCSGSRTTARNTSTFAASATTSPKARSFL